ncbi:MAG: hypothetical protein FRX49_06285 [Trebouxia sp. A1-2]|nr:MAG: hypothetical protein FRX49_06285 [Trebouxia sp. A1-2]
MTGVPDGGRRQPFEEGCWWRRCGSAQLWRPQLHGNTILSQQCNTILGDRNSFESSGRSLTTQKQPTAKTVGRPRRASAIAAQAQKAMKSRVAEGSCQNFWAVPVHEERVQHEVDQQAGEHSMGVEAQQGGAADGRQ